MSNLQLNTSLGMTTASISTWFRVDSSSLEAVEARDTGITDPVIPMDNIVPIITWGTQQTGKIYTFFVGTIGSCPSFDPFGNPIQIPVEGEYVDGSSSVPVQPSCIGVSVDGPGDYSLFVHLQGQAGSLTCVNTGNSAGPDFTCPLPGHVGTSIVLGRDDESFVDQATQNLCVGNGAAVNNISAPGGRPKITPDHWHHLLLSWTLRDETAVGVKPDPTTTGIGSYSLMHCVLDTVDLVELDLPATWVGTDTGSFSDPNAVVSHGTYHTASLFPEDDIGATSSTMSWGEIPSFPLWVPAPISLARQSGAFTANQHIEHGELKIFPGQMLTAANINLFVDGDGKPVLPAAYKKLHGPTPAIYLNGSGNWKKGKNTGSLKVNFSPTGHIPRYIPDPSLNGPQSPSDVKK
jgi:hypothetical protein